MTVGGADVNKTCIFPFIYDGVKYSTCFDDPEGFICSTLVDKSGNHVQGNWGYCGPNCPMPRTKC